jgi:uncharacterized membrane-anchored protein YjiN (DUF445 family)
MLDEMPEPSPRPGPQQDAQRRRRLRNMRLAATGVLVSMAALYVVTGFWVREAPALAYVRAFAEAATVGACADWFAVTALFRRPLGLPIPHTAIIPRNQQRIGEGLGAFIADNFLTLEVLEARLEQLEIGRWGASWLRQRKNAALLAERIVKVAPELMAASTPEARRRFVGTLASAVIDAAPAAPVAAGVLRAVWGGERRTAVLDAGLDLLAAALAQNEDLMRAEVAGRTYRWLPRWVDDKIADAILKGVAQTIAEMRQPGNALRERICGYVDDFIERLETDPGLGAKAEAIKRQLASNMLLADRLGEIGAALESWLRPADAAQASVLAERLSGWLAALGAWLYAQDEAIEILNGWARQAVQRSVAPRRRQIGRAIAGVVASWEVGAVVERLELQVGADLQYIRINGAIVGGLVGLAIFVLSGLLTPR